VSSTNAPRWGEGDCHEFVVYDMSQRVCLEVLDRDIVADDLLGVANPIAVGDTLAVSETPIQLFEGFKFSKGAVSVVKGKKRGMVQMKFEWFNIAPASPHGGAPPAIQGHVLMAELGQLTLPAGMAKSVQVVVSLGARRTRSPYLGRGSRGARKSASSAAVSSALEDVIRKGAKLGVGAETLGQMTGMDQDAVADILAEDDRARPVRLRVGSCLSLPLPRGLAELSEADVQIQVRDVSKSVLASASLRLASAGASPVWPPAGREGEVAELKAQHGAAMTLEVKLFTASLERGTPPAA